MFKKIFAVAVSGSILALALPAFAASSPTGTQVACVGAAVNARESALGTGISSYTQSVSAAYSTRASALQQAYLLTPGKNVIKNAVRAAWSAFSASMKTARTSWQSTRSTSWSKFRTAVKACKAPAVATDSGNSSSEASGQ